MTFPTVLEEFRHTAQEIAYVMRQPKPVPFHVAELRDAKPSAVTCVGGVAEACGEGNYPASFSMYLNMGRICVIVGNIMDGPQVGFSNMEYVPEDDIWRKSGLGFDAMRRMIHAMADRNFAYVASCGMSEQAIPYFRNCGFDFIDADADLVSRVQGGETVQDIKAAYGVAAGAAIFRPSGSVLALADLTTPESRNRLFTCMKMPLG
jgi:hypothetical protein